MEAATIDKAERQRTRKFASRYLELRLVMEPDDDVPIGDHRGSTRRVPGKHVEFREGRFDASPEKAAEMGVPHERLIDFLVGHTNNKANHGNLFEEITEQVPKPDSTELLGQIARLAVERDIPALEGILEEERLEHCREDILLACETALEALAAQPPPETGQPGGALSEALSGGTEPQGEPKE